MATNLEVVSAALYGARSYVDVFGQCDGSAADQKRHISKTYRTLARHVHPDRFHDQDKVELATETFARLQMLHQAALDAHMAGTYGQIATTTIETKRYIHAISDLLISGDIADILLAESTNSCGERIDSVMKVARSPVDNDLLENEAKALRKLREVADDAKFHPYFPQLLESFKLRSDSIRRHANIMTHEAHALSLARLIRAFPNGIDPLHVGWMWRRLLFAVGYAHERKLIHGAITPEHILIQPTDHGLILIDWAYSVAEQDEQFGPLKAIPMPYKAWYPVEVLRKQPPDIGLDIGMAVRSIIQALGGDPQTSELPASVPKQFKAYLRGVLSNAESAMPADAFSLLAEFDELLASIGEPYYPRKFRVFQVPLGT